MYNQYRKQSAWLSLFFNISDDENNIYSNENRMARIEPRPVFDPVEKKLTYCDLDSGTIVTVEHVSNYDSEIVYAYPECKDCIIKMLLRR